MFVLIKFICYFLDSLISLKYVNYSLIRLYFLKSSAVYFTMSSFCYLKSFRCYINRELEIWESLLLRENYGLNDFCSLMSKTLCILLVQPRVQVFIYMEGVFPEVPRYFKGSTFSMSEMSSIYYSSSFDYYITSSKYLFELIKSFWLDQSFLKNIFSEWSDIVYFLNLESNK